MKESSVWSLLLASVYLKVLNTEFIESSGQTYYHLALTNKEARIMFGNMIHDWFSDYDSEYNDFIKALLQSDLKAMNVYMNRKSGFGRYDVILEPKDFKYPAIILEFKVFDPDEEDSLKDTVARALQQINEKQYDIVLLSRGISKENIQKYGFAFQGKKILIGKE